MLPPENVSQGQKHAKFYIKISIYSTLVVTLFTELIQKCQVCGFVFELSESVGSLSGIFSPDRDDF